MLLYYDFMAVYSINDIEKLCGVKAHTLRIWEKRYGIIQPRRTKTNIRYYLDDDLQKVLNICMLNKNGFKISKIAKMSEDEIIEHVNTLSDVAVQSDSTLDALMFSMMELNEYKFNMILNHNISQMGFEATVNEVIYPFMEKLATMWISGSIKGVHESFVLNIIRRKTIAAIDSIDEVYNPDAPRFLIYLPEDETHELSLLFLHFLLKNAGMNVIDLGKEVPLVDVIEGQTLFKANYVCSIFNEGFAQKSIQTYIQNLNKHISDCTILISGYQTATQQYTLPENVKVLNNIYDIKKYAVPSKALST